MNYIRRFQKENIRTVYLVITKKCNLKCSFCIRGDEDNGSDTLSTDNIFRYLDEIHSLNDNIRLIITGGEAVLHPGFRDVLKRSTDIFSKVILCSNGTLTEKFIENTDILRKCGVQISVDGNMSVHDIVRGKGSYQKARDTVRYLISQNINTSVSSTISKENIDSVGEMFEDFYSSGVRTFKLSQEMPGGYAQSRKEFQLGYKEWNDFCDRFRKAVSGRNAEIIMKQSFPFICKNLNMNGVSEEMLSKAGCKAGITLLYIYPDRKVYGCPMLMEYPILDLDQNKLSDIGEKYTDCEIYNYFVDSSSACSSCRYKEICRSGCPGRRNNIDKLWNGDKLCPIVRGDIV